MTMPSTDELRDELAQAQQYLTQVPAVQQRVAFINGVLAERGVDLTTPDQETDQ